MQNYFYDLHDQLVKVEVFKKDGTKETWHYVYDALGRRIAKYCETSDGLEEEREFVWDGSHLLQEVYGNGRYTYIYTDLDSYEPLAQIHNYTNAEGETYQEINYFHCDQIGIPREMTDRDGKLLWFGEYDAWGKLTKETNVTGRAHQPFRLQNQYCDAEIGLHYNFFRYYDFDVGRFVNQDPIKLNGGSNLYQFASNSFSWVDPLGLASKIGSCSPCGSKNAQQMAEELANEIGQNSISFTTATTMGHIDLRGKAHFDKKTQQSIDTPHVQESPKGRNPKTGECFPIKKHEITRPATIQDIRRARKLAKKKGLI